MLDKIRTKLANSHVLTLVGGTGTAQLIAIGLSPILTRLYSPTEFGQYGTFLSASAILAVAITGRYEMAMHLHRAPGAIRLIAWLALVTSVILLTFAMLAYICFRSRVALDFAEVAAISVSAFTLAMISISTYGLNWVRNFRAISVVRIVQSAITATLPIVAAAANFRGIGLIGGALLAQMIAAYIGCRYAHYRIHRGLSMMELKKLVALARVHIAFPRYLIFGHVLNAASQQLPVILISWTYGPLYGGYFLLAQRVIRTPMTIIGSAIGDVFRRSASEQINQNGQCSFLFKKTFKRLFLMALPLAAVSYFFADWIFVVFFGQAWKPAGEVVATMSFMLLMQFVSSPLVSLYILTKRQQSELLMQIVLFAAATGAFLLAPRLGYSFVQAVFIYSVIYSFVYGCNLIVSYRLSKGLF